MSHVEDLLAQQMDRVNQLRAEIARLQEENDRLTELTLGLPIDTPSPRRILRRRSWER